MKTLFASLSILLSIVGQNVAGQSLRPMPGFRNFLTEHGLPSSEVYDLHQDSDGFLWFCTDNGLSKFDGRNFKNYSAGEGLTDNVVFKILFDSEGRTWAATMSNKLYEIKGDTLEAFKYNSIIEKYAVGSEHSTGLFFSDSGKLNMGLGNKGILTIEKNGNATLLSPKSALNYLIEDNQQVFSYQRNPKESTIEISKNGTNQTYAFAGAEKINSGFSYSTKSGDLIVFQDFEVLLLEGNTIKNKISTTNRFAFVKEENGIFVIGLVQGGMHISESVEAFFEGKSEVYFPEYAVTDFLRDSEGGYWFSTIERGVFYCPDLKLVHYGESFGLNDLSYLSVTIKNDSSFYVLSDKRHVYLIDIKNNTLEKMPEFGQTIYPNDIQWCAETNRLFCLGYKLLEFKDGRWITIEDSKTGKFKGNKHIDKIKGETIFYASGKNGFCVYDYGLGKVLFSGDEKVSSDWIQSVHKSKQGQTWIGASNGLFILENGKLNRPKIRNELLSLRVNDIAELPDGRLVISTLGAGLLILDGMELEKLTEENGMATNMVGALEVDEFGRIWAAGKRGLHLITKNENGWNIRVFDKQDGLPDTEVIDLDVTLDQIAFSTPKGVCFLPKETFTEASSPKPKILFNSILVNGVNLVAGSDVELNPQQNEVVFNYHSICFKYPNNMKFGYKILGISDKWMFTSGPKLFISDMKPGKYEVILQTTNSAAAASNELKVKIAVRNHIWSSWWFVTFTLLLICLSLYVLFLAILKIARKNDLNEKKLIQLERSALQAQMNPHFIFNALNSIQSYIAGNENDKATRYLAKFSRLIRMMLNHSLAGKISLTDEIESLTIYMELEQMRFKNKFEFQITIDDEINTDTVQIPPLLIQPYLENAIIHGLAQTRSQGRINLYYLLQDNYLLVTVTDNGIGIEASLNQKTKHSALHKSVGMSITQKRLELLDNVDNDKKVKIEEITDRTGQVLGTKVEVMIKINQEDLPIANAQSDNL